MWPEGYGLYRPKGRSLYPPDELPLARAMRGDTVTNCEIWVRRSSQPKLTILSVNAAPLQNANGLVLGGVAVFRDVTRQKQLERQLRVERDTLKKLLEAREQERTLLAYDLHDGLLQDIVGAEMILSGLQAQCEGFAPSAAQELSKASDSLRRAVREGRRIISGMQPMIVDDHNLVEALAALVDDFSRDTSMQIEFVHFTHKSQVSRQIQATLFRILQESLTNAIRHSETKNIVVLLTELPAAIQLEIRDWGIGFDPKHLPKRGVGLRSIRDRTRLFGGRCRILSRSEHGTRIVVRFPLQSATESLDGQDASPLD